MGTEVFCKNCGRELQNCYLPRGASNNFTMVLEQWYCRMCGVVENKEIPRC